MLPSNGKSILFDNVFLLFFFNREEKNLDKSRYRDVIPGELTRVKLLPDDDDDDDDDFINANYVTGYNNENNAYIFTQGNLKFDEMFEN